MNFVIPAQAGIQCTAGIYADPCWIPAFAGMTGFIGSWVVTISAPLRCCERGAAVSACLSRTVAFQHGLGKFQKLARVQRYHAYKDRKQQALVVVNGDVAKRHHAFEGLGQRRFNPMTVSEQFKQRQQAAKDAAGTPLADAFA